MGQRCDFAALAVTDRARAAYAWMAPMDERLGVRHLERIALGTPYTLVAQRVQEVVWKLDGNCVVAVDATGLGAPVVDMLKEARLPCELSAVVITGGERANTSGGVWHVPKRDLIGGLQILLEKGELRIAKGLREAGSLVRELVDMRGTRRASGRVRLGADGAGEHDDLVMATALACWVAERPTNGFGVRRLPGI